jgi:phage terminase large subunit
MILARAVVGRSTNIVTSMIEVEIHKDVYLSCFQHLLSEADVETDIDIELIWGGRDSGKSKHVAMQLTEECMSKDYFRCILIKKTHESIKDAQWQMVKETAEAWGVDSLFNFKVSPLSITCLNKNSFLTRGMDQAGKIRSITNPSHIWVEEGNQITEEDFITLLTSLRSDHGRVKLIITFNPEADCADFSEFWMYKAFFKDKYPHQLNFTDAVKIKVVVKGRTEETQVKYRSTHVTYHDNPYVTPQRMAFHESLKASNYYWYQVFTLGLWGNQENDSPWAFAFDRKKHVSDGVIKPHPMLDRRYPVYLAWDFNRNPMTCSVIQHINNQVRILETIRLPKSGVDGMCEYIKLYYPGCLFIVTGDYNGDNESSLFQEQVTHYKLIQHYLNLSDGQIVIQPNPKQAKNATHFNTVLAYYDVIFHGEKAKAAIFDCENVKKRADGTIAKADRDDPAQQADALDTIRYFFNNFLGDFQPFIDPAAKEKIQVVTPTIPESADLVTKAIHTISTGKTVLCSREDYHKQIRAGILQQAGKWIDTGDAMRAKIALQEVSRLDKLHNEKKKH